MNDHIAVFDALDHAVHDLADTVLEFVVLAFALGVAHLLEDHLLGGLRGDAAEIDRRQRLGDQVAGLRRRVADLRFVERDLGRLVFDLFDDQA